MSNVTELEEKILDLEYRTLAKRHHRPTVTRAQPCYPPCKIIKVPGVGIRAVAQRGNRKFELYQEHIPCAPCREKIFKV
jgi:hypothetical protein